MANDVQDALQRMLIALQKADISAAPNPDKPVICFSRDHGSGGRTIAENLSKRLGIPFYDDELIEMVANRIQAEPAAVRMLDEHINRAKDMWLFSLFSGSGINLANYRKHMVHVILSIAHSGGVILGRGAHVVLAESSALKVRITGSVDACANRIAQAQGKPIEQAKKEVEELNHNRGKFVWDIFQSRLNDPSQFDLVINTDRMQDPDKILDMIISAYDSIHGK
jgi:cytidylate kinase